MGRQSTGRFLCALRAQRAGSAHRKSMAGESRCAGISRDWDGSAGLGRGAAPALEDPEEGAPLLHWQEGLDQSLPCRVFGVSGFSLVSRQQESVHAAQ